MFFGSFPFDQMPGADLLGGMKRDVDNTGYYDTLGVSKNATPEQIRSAFKKMALIHHPDKGGDSDKFKEVSKAYEVLSDPNKKKMYDSYGADAVESNGGGHSSANDIFEVFFENVRRRGPQKSDDDVKKVEFTLEEFCKGVVKKLAVNRNVVCSDCNGKGAAAKDIRTCSVCHGSGYQVIIQKNGLMIRQSQTPCQTCRTTGHIIDEDKKCRSCSGKTTIKERKVLEVHLPKGAPENYKVKFEGQADHYPDTLPGDLIIVCLTKPHPVFTRQGEHLIMKKVITLKEALVGHSFSFTDLEGNKQFVKTDRIINPGDTVGIENLGMPINGSVFNRGSIYITYTINFPISLSTDEKDVIAKVLPGTNTFKNKCSASETEQTLKKIHLSSSRERTQSHNADNDSDEGAGNVQCRQA